LHGEIKKNILFLALTCYLSSCFFKKVQRKTTLADSICDVRARKVKKTFVTQINALIDWEDLSRIIEKDYLKGKSAKGNPSYDWVLLFKMYLLQSWNGLSDYEIEDRINDSLSFSY
tara:strand:+ start:829 stop:1176 length:348 start_codon:yes stop_codon:yes gene_type:complete